MWQLCTHIQTQTLHKEFQNNSKFARKFMGDEPKKKILTHVLVIIVRITFVTKKKMKKFYRNTSQFYHRKKSHTSADIYAH